MTPEHLPKHGNIIMTPAYTDILLVIDMQRDFVADGAPCRVAGAKATVPAIARALDSARSRGWGVVHVIREHHHDGSDAETFRRHLFGGGKGVCGAGTPGAGIVDELKPEASDYVVVKTRFDAFHATRLELLLRSLGAERLYIAGTQYPNCIRATAVGALERDYEVTVLTDCCSAATPEVAQSNILDLRAMGIRCVPYAELS